MTRASVSAIVVAIAAAVAAGCADRLTAPSGSLTAPDPTSVAALVVSGPAVRPGAVVTVSARLTQPSAAQRTGAYLVHVEYDTTLVTFVGQGDGTSGIAAFHAESGVLRVAGASLDGYTGGVLFNAQFRIAHPSSAAEIKLVIDELRDVNLSDRLPAQASARSSLLRPWR
ncbi:MAG: hypothetical protein ACREPM_09450 [Gemmatimonadaceae bacterium]